MNNTDTVRVIRAFNRMYMATMNLLGNHYLGSDYSVPEMRVLFELYYHPGCTATDIVKIVNIDKSYLSRMLKKFSTKNYLRKEVSDSDGRSFRLYLTEKGIERTKTYIQRSDEEVGKIIDPLSKEEKALFLQSINTLQYLLNKIRTK